MEFLETCKQEIHAIFENCDYTAMLKEDEKKVPFTHTAPDGQVYQVEVEPNENEFYVYQNGKQIDLFNTDLLAKNGVVPSDVRNSIVQDWNDNHKGKSANGMPEVPPPPVATNTPETTPPPVPAAVPQQGQEAVVAETQKMEEMNADVVGNLKKQYPDKTEDEIKAIYYATANKQDRNPETFKKA